MGFEFFSPPRIVFARGAVTRLADLVRPLGNKALIIAICANDDYPRGAARRLAPFSERND